MQHSARVRLSSSHGSTSRARSDVIEALNSALLAASPDKIMERTLKIRGEKLRVFETSIDLLDYERIIVIGGGKAVASMAAGLEKLLGDRITSGLVNIPQHLNPKPRLKTIKLHEGTHPIPSEKGLIGVQKMLEIVGKLTEKDLVICLISGGGSALMPMPLDGLKVTDESEITDYLLTSGATINEINTVRKHLSGIKGGRLAQKLFPARILALVISDVVGDDLGSIASGPTVPDPTTYEDAKKILVELGLWRKIPMRVRKVIDRGLRDKSLDTPKDGSPIFENVSNVLIGTNKQSCLAAEQSLAEAGYSSRILSTHVQGEAKEIGKLYAAILRDMKRPSALILGGETTTTIVGSAGKGGRNQELVLSAVIGISGVEGAVIASMGTDGVDGPTDAAGAIGDWNSIVRAEKLRLQAKEFLRRHNSYVFFEKLGDLIVTGPTGTNVNDISILAVR